MIDADFVDKILEIGKPEVVEHAGLEYLKTNREIKPIEEPAQSAIQCFSLSQLISVLGHETVLEGEKIFVNVLSPFKVEAFRSKMTSTFRRHHVAAANFENVLEHFPSGQQLSQEDFIIKIQSLFEQTKERDDLLKLVSSLKSERLNTSDDDGVSQVASAKAGVLLVSEVKVKNPWSLHPFKSFPEIEATEVKFILRLHQRSEEMPKFALYEADGGQWKVNTTKNIKSYLQLQLNSAGAKDVFVL